MKKVFGPGGMYYSDASKEDTNFYNKLTKNISGKASMSDAQSNLNSFYEGERTGYATGGKIDIDIKRPSALHKAMGIPQDEKIPLNKIEAVKSEAKREGNTRLERQATFAENARHWNKG